MTKASIYYKNSKYYKYYKEILKIVNRNTKILKYYILKAVESYCKAFHFTLLQNSQENCLCWCLFFKKVAGLKPATLLKKRLQHMCFPVNLAKFLETHFLQNTFRWLLLKNRLVYLLTTLLNPLATNVPSYRNQSVEQLGTNGLKFTSRVLPSDLKEARISKKSVEVALN